jgi:colicin import membrane protein
MTAVHAAERFEFAPPTPKGLLRGLGFALLAHAFLLAALTWGVNWKTNPQTASAEAELWSAVPQEAAPKLVEPPPVAPTPPEVAQPPAPPKPAKPAPLPVVQPETPKADIVLAKEKLRLKKEKQDALDAQRLAKLKLEKAEKVEKLRLEKQDKLKQDQLNKEKALVESKKKSALEAKRKEALKAEQEKLENQKIEIQREANLKRIAGLAGATGGAEAKGSALQATGPSPSYAGKLRARIKPNIETPGDIAGNPTAEIEVRTAPDGTIISRKLLKTSGVKIWDDAVLKAIDKTDALPKDTDGRVPSTLIISFKPKD